MGQRYAYFRTPEGRPYRGKDAKHAPNHILSEIGLTAIRKDDGVCWPGFNVHRYETALKASMTVIDPDGKEINETDAGAIIWRALSAIVKTSPATPIAPASLLDACDGLAAEFLRKPTSDYIAVTTLSIGDVPSREILVGERSISVLSERGKFAIPDVAIRHFHDCGEIESKKYTIISVPARGRSVSEAIDDALSVIHLLRGLWSLFVTYHSWSISSGSPKRQAIGSIHTGPFYTLHHPDGRAVDDIYWYAHHVSDERKVFEGSHKWPKIEENRQWAMDQLSKLKYRLDVQNLLVRYAEALDQNDMEIAFLKMWSILEHMTNTVGANYDETIERCIWLFAEKDRLLARDMLKSVRVHRNRIVHAGDSGIEGDQVAYLLKLFVDTHLLQLLRNPCSCESLKEYGELLSMSCDTKELEKLRRHVEHAISMRELPDAKD